MYSPAKITPRIEKLRETYLSLPVAVETDPYTDKKYHHNTGDRWISLGYLEGWFANRDCATTRLRRAYAEASELDMESPRIYDGELMLGQLCLDDYDEEKQKRYDELANMYYACEKGPDLCARMDHVALNYDKLLKMGVNGLLCEIAKKQSEIDMVNTEHYPDYEELKKYEFLESMKVELEALLRLAKRYSDYAVKKAEEKSGKEKEELLRAAKILERVPANPAQNFREAIQSVHFYLSNLFGLYPMGRPDRYLYPYFKKDLESGEITIEEAQEYIDQFCLGVTCRVFSRAASGFIVGGTDKDGNPVENELTYMFVTALDHIKLPDPNGAVAVSSKTSDELMRYCAEVLSHGTTHPALYNDDAIISSLVNYGFDKEDAVEFIHSTCAEISVAGKSKAMTTAYLIDMPKELIATVENNRDAKNIDEIIDAYLKDLKKRANEKIMRYLNDMLEAARNGNEQARAAALVDDCIERGKGFYDGGPKYDYIEPIIIGFATVVDSIVAIDSLVFKEKRLTIAEFLNIIKADFKGNEPLRQYIINRLPHYGNDNETADSMAKRLADGITAIYRSKDLIFEKRQIPGTFSYWNHAHIGSQCIATFDGRLHGYSYSDGCSAVQGRDVNGPTAMIKSLTSWDQSDFLGGMVVNIKFSKGNLSGEKADRFISLVRTFMARGGIEMQVNVVNRETLLDALDHPENHSELMVRIGGYSDYFVRLAPSLQQEIIDRTEY